MDILHSEKQNEEFYLRMRYALQVKGSLQGELWEKTKNEDVYLQRLSMNAMMNDKKQIIHYVAVFSDITQYKQTKDELHFLTHYDALLIYLIVLFFMIQLESAVHRLRAFRKRNFH